MRLKQFSIGAAVLAVILSPVIPAVAGSLSQDQSNAVPPGPPPTAAGQAAAAKAFPPGDGRDEVIQTCGGCHSLTVVSSQRMSEAAWTNTVIEMRGRGAPGSDADMVKIVEYLAKNFGPNSAPVEINVNTAAASDIATGLALPQAQAQAIVDYREKNGKFKDLDALKKVPGVDTDKIDAAKARIEF